MKEKLIIYGAGGHAKAVIDIVEKEGRYEIAGLIDDNKSAGQTVLGYRVLGDHKILPELRDKGITHGFVAIGDNRTRFEKTHLFTVAGFKLITTIHPFSSIGRDTSLQEGCCVFHGAVIDPCVKIGKGVIINKRALVGHDSFIGNFVHVAPGVNCGAEVKVGEESFIGIGATIIPNMTIGSKAIIGAGSVVVRHIPPAVTVLGLPAKIVKTHAISDENSLS